MSAATSGGAAADPELRRHRYDAFISFRGIDTRPNFVSHLYRALSDAGISTFKDDIDLQAGDEIIRAIFGAIWGSKVSVVVLSRGFASSRWCLLEPVEILRSRTTGQLVIPVFYHIDPSDVRRRRGAFAEAFHRHDERYSPQTVQRWRAALETVGNLSGHVLDSSHSDEAVVVEQIIHRVSLTLDDKLRLPLSTFPVGLDSRVQEINSLILADTRAVRFVGILGMGGIGKTTLAKAIYNLLLHFFEAKCFLADVTANAKTSEDLVRLQEQLLHDILRFKRRRRKVHNVDQGISIIKERLRDQKALIILDDVSEAEQVRKLIGDCQLFGSGSIVIVTTRYLDVLDKIKVSSRYHVQRLNDDESLKLLSLSAFEKGSPKKEFTDLSNQIIGYSKGVPLVLEVVGQALYDRSEEEWIGMIQKLKTIPNHDVQSKLRLSFDALGSDDRTKELFLVIACYFVGYDKDYVINILEACGLFPKMGIGDLVRRCLLEVDEDNKLKMHELIQDMGREIIRGKSPDDPGKRSHLWLPSDVLSTLRSHLGTGKVKGIALELGCNNVEIVRAEAFTLMKRLELLKLDNVQIDGEYKHISKELRWLCWQHFSLNFIPNDFYNGKVVAMDMQCSNLVEVWKDNKFLENLKILNLSHSHFLIKTPNFSRLPNLEELILEDCIELAEVDPSIEHLKRLKLASFMDCTKLKNIPEALSRAESLQMINISGCSKIEKLPEEIGHLGSLTKLLADGTAIHCLPSSVGQLKKLTDLSLCGCKKPKPSSHGSLNWSWLSARPVPRHDNNMLISSLSGLSSLRVLKLKDCDLSDDMIPANIGSLQTLEDLDIRQNRFCTLPETIRYLTRLKRLLLDDCKNLESVPSTSASLFSLSAVNCESLNQISALAFGPGIRLFLTNCHKLTTISGLDVQESNGVIHLEQCSNLAVEFKEFLLKDWCAHQHNEVFLPVAEIPTWFDVRTRSSSLSFLLPSPSQGTRIKGFTIYIIYASNMDNEDSRPYPSVHVEPSGFSFSSVTHANIAITPQYHMWAFFLPHSVVDYQESSHEVKLSADFGDGWSVKGMGVHIKKDVVPFMSSNDTSDSAGGTAE